MSGNRTEPATSAGKAGKTGEAFGEGGIRKENGEFLNVAVVQAVILLESKTWVMTPCLEKALKSFHHQEVQNMEGMVHKSQQTGDVNIGLDEIRMYITRR